MKRIGGTLFLIVCCIAFGAILAHDALRNDHAQKVQTSKDQAAMNKAEVERTQLIRQEVNLESNRGLENRARSLGYKRPNENQIPLVPTGNPK